MNAETEENKFKFKIQNVRACVRPFVRPSVKVSVNLFQIAPVRTGSLQL